MAKEILCKRQSTKEGILLEKQNYEVGNEKLYVLSDPAWHIFSIIDGVFHDDYGQGKHLLVENKYKLFGPKTKTNVSVIFVTKDYRVKTIWGTPSRFTSKDPETGLVIELGANGEGEVKIADPKVFYQQVAAAYNEYDSDKLQEFVRSRLIIQIADVISKVLIENGICYYDYVRKLLEISNEVYDRVKNMFLEDYGLTLHNFTLNTIYIREEDKARIEKYKQEEKAKREKEELELKLKLEARELAMELERLDDKAFERKLILTKLEKEDYQKFLDVLKHLNIKPEDLNNKNVKQENKNTLPNSCTGCGKIIPEGHLRCTNCGKPVKGALITCKSCNAQFTYTDGHLCPMCGEKIY